MQQRRRDAKEQMQKQRSLHGNPGTTRATILRQKACD
jgi:hypothetical protein